MARLPTGVIRRIRGLANTLFRRRTNHRELDDELLAFLADRADVLKSAGHSDADAKRLALAEIGGLTQVRESVRLAHPWHFVAAISRDFRFGFRSLRRTPMFFAVAVISLALGIGANTAIFSILDSLVLRQLPVREPAQLIQFISSPDSPEWSNPQWEYLRDRAQPFAGVFAWGAVAKMRFSLETAGELQPLDQYWVSGSFFEVLGVRPLRGRLLTPADDVRATSTSTTPAVISAAFWRNHFNSDESAIGRVLQLNRFPITIVGVTPPDFFGPEVGRSFDVIIPLSVLPPQLLDTSGFSWMSVGARLKPGQTVDQASQLLRGMQASLRESTMPQDIRQQDRSLYLPGPLSAIPAATGESSLRTQYATPLILLMAAVAVVLLIACANLANLLVARMNGRRHEFALRLALGVSRSGLVRQILVECLIVGVLGGVAGLAIATWTTRLLLHQLSDSLHLALDWRVLAFTTAVALGTALIFGIGPALGGTRHQLAAGLTDRPRHVIGSGRWRLSGSLVVGQVALSLLLIVGAGLLLKSFVSLANAPLGFDPRSVIAVDVVPRRGSTIAKDHDAFAVRIKHVLAAVRAIPGVGSAAFSGGTTPMDGYQWNGVLENPVGQFLPESARRVYMRDAAEQWFTTLGMRIVRGRDFGPEDVNKAQGVAVVNEMLARTVFPNQNAIGQVVRELPEPVGPTPPPVTIVGIVSDAVYNTAREGIRPTLYHFRSQSQNLVVRAQSGNPEAIRAAVLQAIRQAEPEFWVTLRPLAAQARSTYEKERLVGLLATAFGVLAVVLAGVGIYGLMAYTVGQRTAELAVRRALGASTGSVTWLVASRSLWLIGAGIAIGSLACLWMMRPLQPLLYGQTANDPRALLAGGLILAVVGMLATWIPVRRATRVSPADLLREG